MGKLCEILAVEGYLETKAKRAAHDANGMFAANTHLFDGFCRILQMFDDDQNENATEDRQELETTVRKVLDSFASAHTRHFDALLQKEAANQLATGDVILENGAVIAEGLPVTFLLAMETRLRAVRAVYEGAPVLPPGVAWERDENMGDHVFRSKHDQVTFKTERKFKSQVIYEATEHHPAQVKTWEEAVNIGKYVKSRWTGLLPAAAKENMLSRIDELIRAFRKARMRANNQLVSPGSIGKELFDYIHGA